MADAGLDFCGLAEELDELERTLNPDRVSLETVATMTRLAWYLRQRDTRRACALCDDAETMLERLSDTRTIDERPIRARLAAVRAEAMTLFGKLAAARDYAGIARATFALLDDDIGVGDAEYLLSRIAREGGDAERMRPALDAAVDAYDRAGDPIRSRIARTLRAQDDAIAGRPVEATQAEPSTHPGVTAFEADLAATQFMAGGNAASMRTELLKGYEAAEAAGLRAEAVIHALNYGSLLADAGDIASALEWKQQALDIAREAGWPRLVASSLVQVAAEFGTLDRLESAKALLEEALVLLAPIGHARTHTNATLFLAEIHVDLGEMEAALAHATEGAAIAEQFGLGDLVLNASTLLAKIFTALDRVDDARAAARRSVELSAVSGTCQHQLEALRSLATIHRKFLPTDETPLAILLRGLAIAEQHDFSSGSEILLRDLSDEYARIGDFQNALTFMKRSVELREQWRSQAANDRATALEVRREVERERSNAEAMELARDAAEEANRAKSAFLAAMSHEIRTPMNAITGMTELLALSHLDTDQRAMLSLVQESAAGLLRVIDDILDFSKIEAGKLELESTAFSPAATAEVVVHTLVPAAQKKKLDLRAEIERPLPRFFGDPFRFRQILFNLTGNALKFTESGSVTVGLEHVTNTDGVTHLIVRVTDTGIGIPPDAVARLFKPFSQADDSTTRRFGGTGLGLSISQRIAEAMGGSIAVASTPGRGSTFSVDLPLDVAGDDDEDDAGKPVVTQQRSFPGLRVLIAEDQPAGRNVIGRQMKTLGITATIVEDGAEAFAAYRPGAFDLLITDCHMPNVDGFELTRMIRRDESGDDSRLPIIALTANALHGEADACLAAGMDEYVSKPASLAQLSAKIAALCGDGVTGYANAAMPRATAEVAVDLAALGDLIGENDETELLVILDGYLQSCDRPLAAARAASGNGDASALRAAAHAGKGSALNVCARSLADAWAAVESAATEGDLVRATYGLTRVETELGSVRHFALTARPAAIHTGAS